MVVMSSYARFLWKKLYLAPFAFPSSVIIYVAPFSVLCYVSRMYTDQFDRITYNPAVMGGKPCIRGMRVTVGMIINQISAGHSIDEILANYPYLEHEDILQALQYAAWRVEEREIAFA